MLKGKLHNEKLRKSCILAQNHANGAHSSVFSWRIASEPTEPGRWNANEGRCINDLCHLRGLGRGLHRRRMWQQTFFFLRRMTEAYLKNIPQITMQSVVSSLNPHTCMLENTAQDLSLRERDFAFGKGIQIYFVLLVVNVWLFWEQHWERTEACAKSILWSQADQKQLPDYNAARIDQGSPLSINKRGRNTGLLRELRHDVTRLYG